MLAVDQEKNRRVLRLIAPEFLIPLLDGLEFIKIAASIAPSILRRGTDRRRPGYIGSGHLLVIEWPSAETGAATERLAAVRSDAVARRPEATVLGTTSLRLKGS